MNADFQYPLVRTYRTFKSVEPNLCKHATTYHEKKFYLSLRVIGEKGFTGFCFLENEKVDVKSFERMKCCFYLIKF